jgi:large subunit ribosomal protein L25
MSWSLPATLRTPGSRQHAPTINTTQIPGVIYGGGQPAIALNISQKELTQLLQKPSSYQPGYLCINNKEVRAIVKAVDADHRTGMPRHVDFLDLDKAKKFSLLLTIKTIGNAPGLKHGGILNILVPRLEVTIDNAAQTIPTELTIDLSEMQVGAVCHLSDLNLPAGVHATNPARDNTILNILPPSDTAANTTESRTNPAKPA